MPLPGLLDRFASPRRAPAHDLESPEPSSRAALRRALGETGYAEYRRILSDPVAELRAEALLNFARRQELSGNLAIAAELYQGLRDDVAGIPASVAAQARAQRDAILGRGDGGRRAEFLLRRLALEACDPAGIAGMVLAGGVFRVARLAALGRLAATPSLGIFSRGFLARAAASTAAFALEAPAFTLGSRATHQALGREVDWSGPALGRDLASSYLVLGGLKVAGWAGGAAYRGAAGTGGILREGPLQLLFQQGGMFGGILFGHWLEAEADLRPRPSGATTLVDSLAMLVQFHVAGRLASRTLGEGFHARELALDLQTETLARSLLPRRRLIPRLEPAWALASAGFEASRPEAPRDPILEAQVLQMSILKDGKGPRNPGTPGPRESGVTRSAQPRPAPEPKFEEVDYFLRGLECPELGLRAFLDSLPMAAAAARIKDGEGLGRFVAVNPKFTELFGYSERQAGAHPLTHFFSLGSAPVSPARLWTLLRAGVFQAGRMEFLGLDGVPRKIWASGVVRNLYGESLAFGFYQPRPEGQSHQPPASPALKVFQAADSARTPALDVEGFFELRSTLELGMQLANPESPLRRHFSGKDLKVRIPISDPFSVPVYAESLSLGLGLLARQAEIPAQRRFSVELRDFMGRSRGLLEWMRGPLGFDALGGGSPGGGAAPAAPRSRATTPPIPRAPRGKLLEEVSRSLANLRSETEDRGSTPPQEPASKKNPDRG
ncbi:MAG: PAS domain-containing protein [Deltaproteobacteria bacterium]|nr:PAS domain-containing protein [Deltaproteobacteria bacterium]